eukprot:gnl/MRDRNA2_/MRDRNA2_61526_c0_seq1.p1 gnl/MRDRNA2_/MRDRNA2_61526_c0~~gnl/MRDRNA2_/MRDRNA2_61526_c0_seq1.p1  ORF type:complete len:2705 (-),score=625.35 gnl/MRDRNA2_/MRDRNA2_61526_c0_seq1:121-7452(-)
MRAACGAQCWSLAIPMLERCSHFRAPPPRGRILLDLSKAEIEVWQACNIMEEDKVSKMLLTPEQQTQREMEARYRSVRLCEQCIMAAKRIDEIDLVEESAVVMWNIGIPLMCDEHRVRIHKSLQKCVEILDEIQSTRLMQLRVQFHFEVARCEVAQDLLTKGQTELQRADALDYTDPKEVQTEGDPAPYIRRFDPAIGEQLHLLHWKLALYEEPTDPADQAMLLLDQVHQQDNSSNQAGSHLAFNLLMQAYDKLEVALDDVLQQLPHLSDTFEPPPKDISSKDALKPLPCQAPATVKENGPDASAIADQKPKSEREEAIVQIKRIVKLMCQVGKEAHTVHEVEFAVKVCDRAIAVEVDGHITFGPPPIEVDGALLLAEAAYTKALCVSEEISEHDVINGVDEVEEEDEKDENAGASFEEEDEEDGEKVVMTAEERERVVARKKEIIEALLYGMKKSDEFGQGWMVANGIAHWWNLHLDLIETSRSNPKLLKRTLDEYQQGLEKIRELLLTLPDSDFDQTLGMNMSLAYLECNVANGKLDVFEASKIQILKRLGARERKEVVARLTELCKLHEKNVPELPRPEIKGAGAPSSADGGKKGGKGGKGADAPVEEDRSELRIEGEVMQIMESIPFAKDHEDALKSVKLAVETLSRWIPKAKDELQLTLWVEMWTRLGRHCLHKPVNPNIGAKYALMCGIKGLGGTEDPPIPKFSSKERLRWRGACHAMCGEACATLVDPHKQEKQSLEKLRYMSTAQFERCCEYAKEVGSAQLAIFGAKSLWNVALPLLHSAETRQNLIEPLLKATRALAAVKYQDDPDFFIGLYASLFDCYSDKNQWDKIQAMLNEAFPVIPSSFHRKLWALRMLALSRQGKNVVIAMGKMKESQASAQASIWLVLAHASSKRVDQFDAYSKAIEILQNANQASVVEVRMEFADWLIRNGFEEADIKDQLCAAADLLLEIEEDMDEDEGEDEGDGRSESMHSRRTGGSSKSGSRRGSEYGSQKSAGKMSKGRRSSRHSGKAPSDGGSSRRRTSARGSDVKSSHKGSSKQGGSDAGSQKSASRKSRRVEDDTALPTVLHAGHYEALVRITAISTQLCRGKEAHEMLLATVHWVMRIFDSSVFLGNMAIKELASMEPEAAEQDAHNKRTSVTEEKKDKKRESVTVGSDKKREKAVPVRNLPPFVLPNQLTGWCNQENSPATELLQEVLRRGEKQGAIDPGMVWIGNPAVFMRPALTFHLLNVLETDLEEFGYHQWMFPVLELHRQLAETFESPVKDAMLCGVGLRLSRIAHACNMIEESNAVFAKIKETLESLPSTFESFHDELEQVRSQRAGRGSSDALDPDWVEEATGQKGKRVSAPWRCNDIQAYEVWAELGKECLLRGELWMACTLVDEAISHSKTYYGDRRSLRSLCIIKARISFSQGHHADSAAMLTNKEIPSADLLQTVEIALMLADTYKVKKQPVLADEVLKDALAALRKSVQSSASGMSETDSFANTTSKYCVAECEIRTAQLKMDLSRLRAMPVTSRDYFKLLDGAFATQKIISEKLQKGGLFFRRIKTVIAFAKEVNDIIENLQQALVQDASLSLANGGPLGADVLARYAQTVLAELESTAECRDELLSRTVPVDGMASHTVAPSMILGAQLDVWICRSMAMRREFLAAAVEEKKQAQRSAKDPGSLASAMLGQAGQSGLKGSDTDGNAVKQDDEIDTWMQNINTEIQETTKVKNSAKEVHDVEWSISMVSNAMAVLDNLRHKEPPTEEGGPGSIAWIPLAVAEGQVELGRLQVEMADMLHPEKKNASLWEELMPEDLEQMTMAVNERFSNVVNGKDPLAIFVPPKTEEEQENAEAPAADSETLFRPGAEIQYLEMGRQSLSEALNASMISRHFPAANRALKALARQAYGNSCPQGTFEFLAMAQSVDVCLRALDIFSEVMPHDHQECVQMGQLEHIENGWYYPPALEPYTRTTGRLMNESPLMQRLRLDELPPVTDLLLSYIPPLTLVVILQLHERYLYVGAACSPAEGAPADGTRADGLRYLVNRIPVDESSVYSRVQKVVEQNTSIEKDLILQTELNESFAEHYELVMTEVDRFLMAPVSQMLELEFFPLGAQAEHPLNPKQILLLPDATLSNFPLERLPSIMSLTGSTNHAAFARDLSLHVFAQRVRGHVEAEGGPHQMQAEYKVVKADEVTLLTDPFSEDMLRPAEDPTSETMCAVHKRLEKDSIVPRGLHGQMYTASPADMVGMFADASAFLFLGFGRFFTMLPASCMSSEDLRHVSLLVNFGRSINDLAFRRQTKTDSMKSQKQLAAESTYGLAVMSAFRGVQCVVMATSPVPIAISMRTGEMFIRNLKEGKSAAKSLEECLNVLTDRPDLRYLRNLEGGKAPTQRYVPTGEGRSDRASLVSQPAETPSTQTGAVMQKENLLIFHSRSAFQIIGVPWVSYGGGAAPPGKK